MNESDYYGLDWLGVEWTEWGPLNPADSHLTTYSTDEGIYRVRHAHLPGLEYIGETGRSTRGRVRSLARGTYAEEMPFRDPHTAAPCPWAVNEEYGPDLEVSVTTPEFATDKQQRKGFEQALIAVYRREVGHSPTANFGRIIGRGGLRPSRSLPADQCSCSFAGPFAPPAIAVSTTVSHRPERRLLTADILQHPVLWHLLSFGV